jgi:methionine-gamma-lyase
MTHSTYTPEQRAAHGISEGLVRLSAGLEDERDLLADVAQALATVTTWRAPATEHVHA